MSFPSAWQKAVGAQEATATELWGFMKCFSVCFLSAQLITYATYYQLATVGNRV